MSSPQRARTGLVISIFGLALGMHPTTQSHAQSIVRAGGESTPVGALSGEQAWPSISAGTTGGWVVWEDNTIEGPGRGRGIAAARIGSNLEVSGTPIRVNATVAGSQEKPQVEMLSGGNALVAWETRAVGTPAAVASSGLYARILSPSGTPVSGDIRISPGTSVTNVKQTVRWSGIFKNKARTRTYKFKEKISEVREHAGGVSLVGLPDGGAIAAYHGVRRTYTNTFTLIRETKYNGIRSTTNDLLRPIRLTGDWMQDVYFQRFDATGRKIGAEVRVNQYDPYNQRNPAVTLLANGNLLIAWVSERPRTLSSVDNFSVSLFAREMSVDGAPAGDEFAVGEDPTRVSANPVVSAVGTGFGIYWSQVESTSSTRWNVYGRVFEAAGRPAGPTAIINEFTTGDQFAPRVANSGAAQMVVWTSLGQDGSREGVYGRMLVNGMPTGAELPVNTTIPSRQYQAVLSGAGDGRFLAVWSGYTGASGFDLYSQVYQTNAAQQ